VSVLAQEFAEAREAQRSGDDAPRQNFRNNREGQVWVLTGQRAEEERLAEHCEAWNDHRVPVGVDRVVYAVDVQRDHVWAGIIGWGYAYAAYLIAVDRIETGPLERIENWDPVLAWLREPVTDGVEEGRLWHPQMRMIDSGDGMLTDVIYQACLEADVPVWPSKGDSNVPRNRYWRVRDLDRRPSRRGKKSAGGLKLYEYQPDVYKDRVARFMTATKPGAGYLHLPRLGDGFPPTHLRQLCAEEPVQVRRGGGVINQWQLRRGRRDNHVFDLMVMATMMADVIGVRRIPNPAGQSDDAAVASQPATYRPRWAR
jgi:phage terminase large subunit GpA-like protein